MKASHTTFIVKCVALALGILTLGCAKYVPASVPKIPFHKSIPSLKLAIRPLRTSKYQDVESVTISWGEGENRCIGRSLGTNNFEFSTVPELSSDVWIQMKKREGSSSSPHWHSNMKLEAKDVGESEIIVLHQSITDAFCGLSHCPEIYLERVHWWNKKWWGTTHGA